MTAFAFRRHFNRQNNLHIIIPLIILGFLIVIAYYAYNNYLMTGSFGLIGFLSQARSRVGTAVKSAVTFVSGLFGMLIDAIMGFSNAVVVAALNGNIAAWVWLFGYSSLLIVLIWNYIATGGTKVIR